jgi:hypothetical protein
MNSLIQWTMLLVMNLALALQGGDCGVSGGGSYYEDNRRPPSGNWGGGGWAQNRPPYGIPANARMVRETRGRFDWQAPRDGRFFLYDAREREVMMQHPVRRGQLVVVKPDRDSVDIENREVWKQNLRRNNVHQLWFDAADGWGGSGGSGGGGGGGWSGSLPPELRDAQRVAYGRGDISYTARRDGKVWVWDATRGEIKYRGELRRDDRLIVSPERDYISLREGERRAAGGFGLNPRHDHEIYFLEGRGGGGGSGGSGDGRYPGVPRGAQLVMEGRSDLSWRVSGRGEMFVFDEMDNRVVYQGRVREGQRFTVAPDRNMITIDGQPVSEGRLSPRRSYKVFFSR